MFKTSIIKTTKYLSYSRYQYSHFNLIPRPKIATYYIMYKS